MILILISLGIAILGCILFGANTSNNLLSVITSSIACLGVIALLIIIGCTATLPERDTADAAKIKTSEGEQILEIVPVDTAANITVTTESITTEQLIKAFIDKWNGVLPDTITVYIPENINYETEKIP